MIDCFCSFSSRSCLLLLLLLLLDFALIKPDICRHDCFMNYSNNFDRLFISSSMEYHYYS